MYEISSSCLLAHSSHAFLAHVWILTRILRPPPRLIDARQSQRSSLHDEALLETAQNRVKLPLVVSSMTILNSARTR
ncbi:uncharacterized protein BJX67DRAFT_348675 [Aspergillus lucknowensis]|uniref:Uncharacterized protein n=1 Tax=Aspergillus lucknowensis TaxID=176173 RepID=A0ABR4LX00_9EURO